MNEVPACEHFPLSLLQAAVSFRQQRVLRGIRPRRRRGSSGLITGIGFIGGGAIIKQAGAVQGTATAAGLWATGAVGAAVGLGSYDVAIVVTLFTIFTFRILSPVKQQKTSGDDIGPPSGSS
jgi:putative Mg2+ transporter-C (MgtC) family protein